MFLGKAVEEILKDEPLDLILRELRCESYTVARGADLIEALIDRITNLNAMIENLSNRIIEMNEAINTPPIQLQGNRIFYPPPNKSGIYFKE